MIGNLLLLVLGVWLLLQTLVGGLPRKLLELGSDGGVDGGMDGSPAGPVGSGLARLFGGADLLKDQLLEGIAGGDGAGPTAGIQLIARAVSARGFAVTGSPTRVCRPPNLGPEGEGEGWSQHAYQNAIDYFGSAGELQRLYEYLRDNPDNLPVDTLCYNGQGPCPHPHDDHVHIDALPRQRGFPPGC